MGRPKKPVELTEEEKTQREKENRERYAKEREEQLKREEEAKKLTIQQIAEWKTHNTELIEIFKTKGFQLEENPSYPSKMIWFEKEIKMDIDLGADITDETLIRPQTNGYPKELIEKYQLNLHTYTDFYDKLIHRTHQWVLRMAYRINTEEENSIYYGHNSTVNGGYETYFRMGLVTHSENLSVFKPVEKNWRIQTCDLVTMNPIITEIEEMITNAMNVIQMEKPKTIETLRNRIITWKNEYNTAIRNTELLQFLYGAIIQFDALQKIHEIPKPKSTIE